MYISDCNEKAIKKLTKWADDNDISFEVWENPMGDLETATFLFPNNKRLFVTLSENGVIISINHDFKGMPILIENKDFYQLVW